MHWLKGAPKGEEGSFIERAAAAARRASAAPDPNASAADERSVRIFVSSTFRDMQAERDILVKAVFPALRSRMRARGVELFEVDLRWGVTEEQAERGETLPLLMAEIDRCRPFFIALLGERYGWVPDAETLDASGVAGAAGRAEADGRSVTEMEIEHGALGDPETRSTTLFFMRDPNWSEAQRPRGDFVESDPTTRARLAALKARIRDSGRTVIDYAAPDALGAAVETALGALLEERFADQAPSDPAAAALRLHAAYARERRRLHVGAEAYLGALDAWAETDEAPPLLIGGAPGAGKSTLIANWLEARRAARPQDVLIAHYLGAAPESADPLALMRRLWTELDQALALNEPPPPGDAELIELSDALRRKLIEAGRLVERRGGRVVLALDGLDKLAREANLRWLPAMRIPGAQLLLSSLPGEAADAARALGATQLEIAPLDSDARRALAEGVLARWGRDLSEAHLAPILAHPLAETPLFIRTVLDELRFSATHERLDARLEHYLAAADMPDLFARLLQRLEEDSGDVAFVGDALALIWASRAGLEETEIIALCGAAPLAWAQLRNALGEGLRDQAGRATFNHDALADAVAARYLPSSAHQRLFHRTLAREFAARAPDARQAEELPYQLRAADDWARLEALLVDLDRFALLRGRGDGELLGHWLALAARGRDPERQLCAALRARAGAPERWSASDLDLAFDVATFLHYAGATGEAIEQLADDLAAACARLRGDDHPDTLAALNDLAAARKARGDLAGAQTLEAHVLEARSNRLGADHPHTLLSLNNLAATLDARGDLVNARKLHEEAAAAAARVLGPEHPDTLTCRSNLASTLHSLGALNEAAQIDADVLATRRRVLGPEHPETLTSMNNLAADDEALGDLSGALTLAKEVAALNARLLGAEHPQTLTSRQNLAGLLRARGELAVAAALEENVLEIRERALGSEHPDTLKSRSGLAASRAALGDFDRALELQKTVLETSVRTLGDAHPDSLAALNNLAHTLREQGAYEAAEARQTKLVEIMTATFGSEHPNSLASVENLAGTRFARGDLAGAAQLIEEVVATRRRLFGDDHPGVLTGRSNLASLLYARGDFAGAAQLQEETLAASRRVLGDAHPETLKRLNNLAATRLARGEAEQARPLFVEVLEARRRVLGPDHPETLTSLGNLAQALHDAGALDEARTAQEEALEVETRIFGRDNPRTLSTLSNLALTLYALGKLEDAQRIQEEVADLREHELGPTHPATLNALGNLAATELALGELQTATTRLRRVAEGERDALGADHPATLTTLGNLALALCRGRQHQEAFEIQRDALEAGRRTLGEDHPHMRIAAENLAAIEKARDGA